MCKWTKVHVDMGIGISEKGAPTWISNVSCAAGGGVRQSLSVGLAAPRGSPSAAAFFSLLAPTRPASLLVGP